MKDNLLYCMLKHTRAKTSFALVYIEKQTM